MAIKEKQPESLADFLANDSTTSDSGVDQSSSPIPQDPTTPSNQVQSTNPAPALATAQPPQTSQVPTGLQSMFGKDVPEPMTTSLLRGMFSQSPTIQPQIQPFEDNVSPARAILTSVVNGLTRSTIGQQFFTNRAQRYREWYDLQNLRLLQQQRDQQMQLGQMNNVVKVMRDQNTQQFHQQLNDLRNTRNTDLRNYQQGQLQARLGMNDVQFRKFLSEDAYHKSLEQHLQNQDANTINPVSKDPEYIRAKGLIDAQYRAKGIDPNDESVYPQYLQQVNDQAEAFKAQQAAMKPNINNFASSQSDKSYQFNAKELDALAKPITDLNARFSRLQSTIDQGTPQADALVAPELLSVMAGGGGSGLRMNEAEISRIVGGRSKWEDLQASVNKWNRDPSTANSITSAQRGQIRALMNAVQGHLQAKQNALTQGYSDLAGTTDIQQHRAIVDRTRRALIDADNTTNNIPTVSSQSDYDAVPKGSKYYYNGTLRVKK